MALSEFETADCDDRRIASSTGTAGFSRPATRPAAGGRSRFGRLYRRLGLIVAGFARHLLLQRRKINR
ncbi:MAG TPA: hypothetical protein P5256_06255, partial [Beijerinckiaceae bacterium]|nr:hypothetical protein [Rhodoblastus sp.]HRY02705.1 hypothetical protein [Beijerinckiaceae bacterium]